MAHEIPGDKRSAIAAAALTQHTFVKAATGTGQLTVTTATTAASGTPCNYVGVVQNAPASGAIAELMTTGTSKVKCSEAINTGQYVTIGANGTAAVAAAGAQAAGLAESTTAGADELVSVMLLRGVVAS